MGPRIHLRMAANSFLGNETSAIWLGSDEWRSIGTDAGPTQIMQRDRVEFEEQVYSAPLNDDEQLSLLGESNNADALNISGTVEYELETFLFDTRDSEMMGLQGEQWEDYWAGQNE